MDNGPSKNRKLGRRMLVAIGAFLAVGWVGGEARADALGTATGSTRTGLARAGLVEVSSLGDAHLWLGLKDALDASARFDVRVELLNNGVPVASGLERCVSGLGNDSSEVVVPWSSFPAPTLRPGDVLALRVSARMGTTPLDTACGLTGSADGLRLDAGSAGAASNFGATIVPDPAVALYLHGGDEACSAGAASPSLSENTPTGSAAHCQDSSSLAFAGGNPWSEIGTWDLAPQCDCANEFAPRVAENPPAPEPEPIEVTRLPLPGTGNVSRVDFMDNTHVLAVVGGSVYMIKTDGTTFSSGDPWKCIDCDVPAENQAGASGSRGHLRGFPDGMRLLAGNNIIDCSPYLLADDECTPERIRIHLIRWNTSPDGSGSGGSMREIRLHPDGVHLMWNQLQLPPPLGDSLFVDEFAFYGRLVFNPNPTTGTPQAPRYDLENVTWLMGNPSLRPACNSIPIEVDPEDPTKLIYNQRCIIGEARGFTGDGSAILGVGTAESLNMDGFATSLFTDNGESHRLTADAAYMDPIDVSRDDQWTVTLDVRRRDRFKFIAGLPGVPPIIGAMASTLGAAVQGYNDGSRRLFQPYLLDRYGDRGYSPRNSSTSGGYHGQQLNACSTPEEEATSGSICDDEWGTRADPRFSPDGTKVVYYQVLASAPNCNDPENCPVSTEPGGRTTRAMLAHLTSREPVDVPPVPPAPDVVPWGTPYTPGDELPPRPHVPAGIYTMDGKVFGSAQVTITETTTAYGTEINSITITYDGYSDDGFNVLNGTEQAFNPIGGTLGTKTFNMDLQLTGCHTGTKVTGPEGYTTSALTAIASGGSAEFTAVGTMTTTVDGQRYVQPENGQ